MTVTTLSSTSSKMYAVVDDTYVLDVYVGPLEKAPSKWKNLTFVEMVVENSPAAIGWKWNGKIFYNPNEESVGD
jgi:hypothetical protein